MALSMVSRSPVRTGLPFDPGIETGYLRRATRDHDLDPGLGAHPFDPGAGAGYDDRRARKDEKRRAREERARRERERKAREERDRSMARPDRRGPGRPTAAGTAAAAAAEPEPLIELDEPAEVETGGPAPVTELRGLRPRRRSLVKQLERERAERERQERERRALVERKRIERERADRERRERRQREREERLRRDREALRRKRRGSRAGGKRRKRPPGRSQSLRARCESAGTLGPSAAATSSGPPRRRGSRSASSSAWRPPRIAARASRSRPQYEREPGLTGEQRDPLRRRPGDRTGVARGVRLPGRRPRAARLRRGGGQVRRRSLRARPPGTGRLRQARNPLLAVRDGIVLDGGGGKSFYAYGGGNALVMYSPADDRSYVYLHMLEPSPLRAGDEVRAGQVVGQVGCTGSCYGATSPLRDPARKGGLRARGQADRPAALPAAVGAARHRLIATAGDAGNRIAPCPRSPTSRAAPRRCSPSIGRSAAMPSIRRRPISCSRRIESSRRMTTRGS